MQVPIFHVDAFTTTLFSGNPAAVVILEEFLEDRVLQAIAGENNLSETAFVVHRNGDYHLRWFTPTVEVSLCGHATLASAAVIMERLAPHRTHVVFHSLSGPLAVARSGGGYAMNFPAWPSTRIDSPSGLSDAIGIAPLEVVANASLYLARLDHAENVRQLTPDFSAILGIGRSGLIVTAPGDGAYDFTSRFFAPAKGIPEDPVTGSAHCMLVPYWAGRLGKTEFHAYQASRRGGDVHCRMRGDRVELEGRCVFFFEGSATI